MAADREIKFVGTFHECNTVCVKGFDHLIYIEIEAPGDNFPLGSIRWIEVNIETFEERNGQPAIEGISSFNEGLNVLFDYLTCKHIMFSDREAKYIIDNALKSLNIDHDFKCFYQIV